MIIHTKMGWDETQIHMYFFMAFFGFKIDVEIPILDLDLSLSLSLISERATEGLEHLPGLLLFVCFCFYCSFHLLNKTFAPCNIPGIW